MKQNIFLNFMINSNEVKNQNEQENNLWQKK